MLVGVSVGGSAVGGSTGVVALAVGGAVGVVVAVPVVVAVGVAVIVGVAVPVEVELFGAIEKEARKRGVAVETLVNLWLQQKLVEQL